MPLVTPNPPENFPECNVVEWVRRNAGQNPALEAVVCGKKRLNWQEFDQRINRVSNALIALGIKKGDRVAVLASTSIEYVEIFMGTLRSGACMVPLSTMASSEALGKMVDDSGARALFLSASLSELANPFIDSLKNILPGGMIALDFEKPDWKIYKNLLADASETDPLVEVKMKDLFNIIYSSGTTGVPKGILHNHMMRAVQMERVKENGYSSEARTLLPTPLYSNTTIVALLPTLVGGGTVVLMPKFDARRYLELAEQERCTHTSWCLCSTNELWMLKISTGSISHR